MAKMYGVVYKDEEGYEALKAVFGQRATYQDVPDRSGIMVALEAPEVAVLEQQGFEVRKVEFRGIICS